MDVPRCRVGQQVIGVLNNGKRVADELDIVQFGPVSEFEGAKQSQPLRVAAGAVAQIVKQVNDPAYHHSRFHPARVGSATSIEKDLDPARGHMVSFTW